MISKKKLTRDRGLASKALAILRARIGLRISRSDLAEASDVRPPTIERAERGEHLDRATLDSVASALGLQLHNVAFLDTLRRRDRFWVTPSPSPYFFGRDKEVGELGRLLSNSGAVAIAGASQMGKSELALQYCYQTQDSFPGGILWIDARSDVTARRDLLAVARTLGLSFLPEAPEALASTIYSSLAGDEQWLAVVDGGLDRDRVERLVPPTESGGRWITTGTAPRRDCTTLSVDALPIRVGTEFLLLRSHFRSIPERARETPDQLRAAAELTRILGGVPSLLEAAGAAVCHRRCGFVEYHSAIVSVVSNQVKAVWSQNVEASARLSPEGDTVLRVLVRHGYNSIPIALLRSLAEEPEFRGFKPNQALRAWLRLSLVAKDDEHEQVSVLPPVQKLLARKGPPIREHAGVFARAMRRAFKRLELPQRVFALESAEVSARNAQRCGVREEPLLDLRLELGRFHLAAGSPSLARTHLRKAREGWKRFGDSDSFLVAVILNNEGIACDQLGEFSLAQSRYSASRKIVAQVGGLPPDTECSLLNNLAITTLGIDDPLSAKRQLLECIALAAAELGSESPALAMYYNNLAAALGRLGQREEAHRTFEKSLLLRRSDASHSPDALAPIQNNWGRFLLHTGEWAGAERLLLDAESSWRRTLGKWHPSLANVLNNLGELYLRLERYEVGRAYLQESLEIRERVLPPLHQHRALSLVNLARVEAARAAAASENERARFRRSAYDFAGKAEEILRGQRYHFDLRAPLRELSRLLSTRSAVVRELLRGLER